MSERNDEYTHVITEQHLDAAASMLELLSDETANGVNYVDLQQLARGVRRETGLPISNSEDLHEPIEEAIVAVRGFLNLNHAEPGPVLGAPKPTTPPTPTGQHVTLSRSSKARLASVHNPQKHSRRAPKR